MTRLERVNQLRGFARVFRSKPELRNKFIAAAERLKATSDAEFEDREIAAYDYELYRREQ